MVPGTYYATPIRRAPKSAATLAELGQEQRQQRREEPRPANPAPQVPETISSDDDIAELCEEGRWREEEMERAQPADAGARHEAEADQGISPAQRRRVQLEQWPMEAQRGRPPARDGLIR